MILEKPAWLRKRLPLGAVTEKFENELLQQGLHTICQEGCCPNQGECFSRGTATFLIMGNVCTRNCSFCAVATGIPGPLKDDEPVRLAKEIGAMGLRFVVITSVTRDDLPDGGADHFTRVINGIRRQCPGVGIEVLIPDFKGSIAALHHLVNAVPEVVNHNVETVPRLYPKVRPQARYDRSLKVLKQVKAIDPSIITKSGIMVGLGEEQGEVEDVMADLCAARCDILTIGQYLCPSRDHYPVKEYVRPETFSDYKKAALRMGFKAVESGSFVRSSYRAVDSYIKAAKI